VILYLCKIAGVPGYYVPKRFGEPVVFAKTFELMDGKPELLRIAAVANDRKEGVGV
jgi:hypothetical protein